MNSTKENQDFITSLFELACKEKASDIHIDPGEIETRIQFRIDGKLYERYRFTKQLIGSYILKIKILAKLRTDEHHIPQDGRFSISLSSEKIDIRVSVIPTYYGENAVLRLLRNVGQSLNLADIGLRKSDCETIMKALSKNDGMILTTGPTGAGKTTTLYSCLKHIHTGSRSIITIEDPVEYAIPGIRHIQVQASRLSFSAGLRSVLRQDPDIIMVGEIRDTETARIAIHTALTGHLLLSSIHTTHAVAALPRLIDMGIEPYLVASTVSLIIAQRLIRKICPYCAEEIPIEQLIPKFPFLEIYINKNKENNSFKNNTHILKAHGCEFCNDTGYDGRIGVYEVLTINREIQEAILERMPIHILHARARMQGLKTLFEHGLEKVFEYETTLEEIIPLLHEEYI